ncbi:MAG: hypothetical protein GC165_07835 [Armatimonadetes bacterium]|nr:hypothetical protein [Armatimonadota bacterium]
MTKRAKIILGTVLGLVVYACIFGFISVLNFVDSKAYYQTPKVFTTDGARLFVGDQNKRFTYHQIFADRQIRIDGAEVYAWLEGSAIHVWIQGVQTDHELNRPDYPVWSPTKQEFYFVDSEKGDMTMSRIWKWSKATGFIPISKPERNLFYLRVARDGLHLTAMQYLWDQRQENALVVCNVSGERMRKYSYGYYNFSADMIGEDDFLVNTHYQGQALTFEGDSIHTYRWSPRKKQLTPFAVNGRPVSDTIAFGGKIYALFQEPSYHYYPWMVARETDRVSVVPLTSDLSRPSGPTQLLSGY